MSNIVKTTTLPSFLDLIAPHYCRGCERIGKPICDRCKKYIIESNTNLCPICKKENPTGICPHCVKNSNVKTLPPTFIVGKRIDLLNTIIHDYKYNSVRALAIPLAEMLNIKLPNLKGKVIIVPLPTISKHIRSRGLDHTYLIAKKLAKLRPNFQVSKILLRNNNSVQVGSDHDTRITQALKAYKINPKFRIKKDTTYVLLDDVWTTGASLQSAIRILNQNGINKIILAILSLSILD